MIFNLSLCSKCWIQQVCKRHQYNQNQHFLDKYLINKTIITSTRSCHHIILSTCTVRCTDVIVGTHNPSYGHCWVILEICGTHKFDDVSLLGHFCGYGYSAVYPHIHFKWNPVTSNHWRVFLEKGYSNLAYRPILLNDFYATKLVSHTVQLDNNFIHHLDQLCC